MNGKLILKVTLKEQAMRRFCFVRYFVENSGGFVNTQGTVLKDGNYLLVGLLSCFEEGIFYLVFLV